MSAFSKTHVDMQAARTELHDALALTGAEVSFNCLPAGASVPFVHSHKHNEEIYLVLAGRGCVWNDVAEHEIEAGDSFSVFTGAGRCIKAAQDSELRFACVQVREGSLEGYTMTDAEICQPAQGPDWLAR